MEKKLRDSIKVAMKVKMEDATLENIIIYQTRKNILETAQKIAKEKKIDISDSLIYDAAKKEIKQANDLISYVTDKNSDKYAEIQVIIRTAEEFLPQMVTEDEIKNYVESHKDEFHNIGEAMKALKSKYGDSLDGKLASQIVRQIL